MKSKAEREQFESQSEAMRKAELATEKGEEEKRALQKKFQEEIAEKKRRIMDLEKTEKKFFVEKEKNESLVR